MIFTRVRALIPACSIPLQKDWNCLWLKGWHDLRADSNSHWKHNFQQHWSSLAAQHNFWFITSYFSRCSIENWHCEGYQRQHQLRVFDIQVQRRPPSLYRATAADARHKSFRGRKSRALRIFCPHGDHKWHTDLNLFRCSVYQYVRW